MPELATVQSIEALFKHYTGFLAIAIEIVAAVIIGLAAVQAAYRSLRAFVLGDETVESWTRIRIRLGRWLAVALEFELAADILGTAVTPTWDDVGKLAAIIVLRTLLNYFLHREVREADEQVQRLKHRESTAAEPPAEVRRPPGRPV